MRGPGEKHQQSQSPWNMDPINAPSPRKIHIRHPIVMRQAGKALGRSDAFDVLDLERRLGRDVEGRGEVGEGGAEELGGDDEFERDGLVCADPPTRSVSGCTVARLTRKERTVI